MVDIHLRKLRARDDISVEEEQAIRAIVGAATKLPANVTFVPAGKVLHASTMLLQGFICRYKDLSQGQRQITEVHTPGDFADLHSFTLKHLDHALMTLTPSVVAEVPHSMLQETLERHPHLTRVYWFGTNLDAAIHREWEVSLGRRSAIQRTAHLFCELQARLNIVGLADNYGFAFPVTQMVLAECLGLTSVHVNRVLKELRERDIAEFRGGRVIIHNFNALREIGEFDPAYLYLDRKGERWTIAA